MGVFQQGYWSQRQLTQSSTRSPSPEVGRQETDIPSCRQVRSRWALGVRAEGHIPGGCRAMAGGPIPALSDGIINYQTNHRMDHKIKRNTEPAGDF